MLPEEKKCPVQSVARAAAILRCFADSASLGLTEISRAVGLNKSTAAGLVTSLKAEGFLAQKADGSYTLGPELFRLGSLVNVGLEELSGRHLKALLDATNETVNLATCENGMVTYVSKLESTHSVRIISRIGQSLPFYCAGIGKAIYAFLDEAEVSRCFAALEKKKYTEKTILDYDALLVELARVRRNGYAIDYEEYEYGLVCVAAPIFNRNRVPVASVSVSGPTVRMDYDTIRRISGLVAHTAGVITDEYCGMR